MKRFVFIIAAMLAFTASTSAQSTAIIKKSQAQTEQKANRAARNAEHGAKAKVNPKIGTAPSLGPSKELKSAARTLSPSKARTLPAPDSTAVRIAPNSALGRAMQARDSINAAQEAANQDKQ